MADKQPNQNSQYRRLRRRAVRQRSKVSVDRIADDCRNHAAPLIHDEHLVQSKLIDLRGQTAAVFTKIRLNMGEMLALTLTLGNELPVRTVGEVIALKRVEKHGGYLATISFLCINHEHRTTVDQFLAGIELLITQEMKRVL